MELSPNLENVDIRAWAQQIREMKIREFEEYIKTVKKHFGTHESSMHPILQMSNKFRIMQLERKLETLKNTK
jgi:hypothetical protein